MDLYHLICFCESMDDTEKEFWLLMEMNEEQVQRLSNILLKEILNLKILEEKFILKTKRIKIKHQKEWELFIKQSHIYD